MGFIRNTKWPKNNPMTCGTRVTTMPPNKSPIPASLNGPAKFSEGRWFYRYRSTAAVFQFSVLDSTVAQTI